MLFWRGWGQAGKPFSPVLTSRKVMLSKPCGVLLSAGVPLTSPRRFSQYQPPAATSARVMTARRRPSTTSGTKLPEEFSAGRGDAARLNPLPRRAGSSPSLSASTPTGAWSTFDSQNLPRTFHWQLLAGMAAPPSAVQEVIQRHCPLHRPPPCGDLKDDLQGKMGSQGVTHGEGTLHPRRVPCTPGWPRSPGTHWGSAQAPHRPASPGSGAPPRSTLCVAPPRCAASPAAPHRLQHGGEQAP